MQDEGNTTSKTSVLKPVFFSIYILHTVTLNAAELPVSRSCGCTVNYCDSPETLKTCRFSGSFCSVRLHGGLFAFKDKLLEV